MTDIAKRPPSLELPNIRELYEKADWPQGEFHIDPQWPTDVVTPDGEVLQLDDPEATREAVIARTAFVVEACNYWLGHLRGGEARETQRIERKANAVGQSLRTIVHDADVSLQANRPDRAEERIRELEAENSRLSAELHRDRYVGQRLRTREQP